METMIMRKFGFPSLLVVAAVIGFILLGIFPTREHSHDFVPVYSGARCLIHGCNPYDTAQLSDQYGKAGGTDPTMLGGHWPYYIPPVYPPSAFVLILPFALLRFPIAKVVWFLLNAGLLLLALRMVWASCSQPGRWLGSLLVAFFLLNSAVLLQYGQPAGPAISLLIIVCMLFSGGRRLLLAACLLCVSLALKPQIGGLIALYLLIKKANRRYVCAAMVGAIVVLLAGALVLQRNPSSKDWITDMRANIASSTLPGSINDPRLPAAEQVNLEGATLILSSDAKVSSIICYGMLLLLLGAWVLTLIQSREYGEAGPIMLAALAVFSLLPVYHRFYDTPLLILTIPATVIVYNQRRGLGSLIAVTTVFAATLTEKHLNALLHRDWILKHLPGLPPAVMNHKILYLLVFREQILAMVILFCLYLAAMLSRDFKTSYRTRSELARS
jgi:hypothetical protein